MSSGPTHIYISGPMRNRDGFNFPAFFEAEAALREEFPEADICNPAREDVVRYRLQHLLEADPTGLLAGRWLASEIKFDVDDLREALSRDLDYVCSHCDLLVLLPDWKVSKGAQAELAAARAIGVRVAEYALGQPFTAPEVQPHTPEAERPGDRDSASPAPRSGEEVRYTSATGGQKGAKLAAFDQISPEIEWELAEHFGKGARKYEAHNFRRGYPWSFSYSALRRHLSDFWRGKRFDSCPPDGRGCRFEDGEAYEPGTCYNHTGSREIICVLWHAMTLAEFELHREEYDDRYVWDA